MNLNSINNFLSNFSILEIITFLIGVVFITIISIIIKKRDINSKEFIFFLFGFYSILIGLFFTNIESILLPKTFNILEHLFYMLASLFFLLGVIKHKQENKKVKR
jgi:hypothetical protein